MGPETEELEAVEYGDPKSNGAHPAPILSAEELLAMEDVDSQEVYIPKWGRSVRIREITKAQHQQMRKDALKIDTKGGYQFNVDLYERKLLQASMAEPELTDAEVSTLMQKSAQAIEYLLGEIKKINGMDEEAKKEMALSFR